MAAPSRVVRCAVIGCGHWGPNHVRVLGELSGCEIVAVSDIHADRIARVVGRFPHLRGEMDYRVLLNDRRIDAVVIATAASTHAALTQEALESGKHVLCEKPFCVDPVDARALVALAAKQRLTLMVGHTFMFNAGIRALKRLVAAGELGQVRHLAAVRANLGPVRSDVNAAYDLACHDISIFNWVLGAVPEYVAAHGASFLQPGIEDTVQLSLRYPGDVVASIRASWYDPRKIRELTVVGARRMATWDDLDPTAPLAIHDKSAVPNAPGARPEFIPDDRGVTRPMIDQEEPLKVQDQAFIDAVRGANLVMPSDGAYSINVIEVLAAANKSMRARGAAVPVIET